MKCYIRPAKSSDLSSLLHFADVRASGITSLPQDRDILKKKLTASQEAFANGHSSTDERYYLFVLQYGEKVIGVSGIKTAVGKETPFFVYALDSRMQRCRYLSLEYELQMLHFENIKSLPTELSSLFLEARYRKRHLGRLLSYSRFLFMQLFPQRFGKTILAQLRGVSDKKGCPFWDAVGSKFYNISFDEADTLRVNHPQSIIELFPKSPIYPAMLPKRAQKVIRVPHKSTVPARLLLEKEGFTMSTHCDIFDAGPHFYAARDSIKAIQKTKKTSVHIQKVEQLGDYLISNEKIDFRATVAPLQRLNGAVAISKETAALLDVKEGDNIRYLEL